MVAPKGGRTIDNWLFTLATPQVGYHGDEDQIEAFSSLMAIGLFDFQGGAAQKPTWHITAPVFDSVTIHLNKDYYKRGVFKIRRH